MVSGKTQIGAQFFLEYLYLSISTWLSSTQNNKYQVPHKHSCISWWWALSRPKHVEIGKHKYTKKNLHQVGFVYKIKQRCTVNKT